MNKVTMTLVLAVFAATEGFAANAPGKIVKGVLKAGTYSAKVAALVCAACPPEVEKTLKTFPGIERVAVSQKESTVRFKIKKGASVSEAKLQAALKAAANKEGMGADYSLSGLRRVGP